MTNVEQLIRSLSKKYKIPFDIMQRICLYEFKFASKKMHSYDNKDILMHYLFKFKPKEIYRKNNDERHNKLEENENN